MQAAVYAIAAVTLLGVVLRPWRSPEAIWSASGAAALLLVGLVSWPAAGAAVAEGTDVYLFLIGMMLLASQAEREGLFDWLASLCVAGAGGSATRLFLLVYAVGTLVAVFMSNDATAVVLTPAVLAVTRQAKVRPLPYLLACALIANAASFVLPISNPANLVVFGDRLPSLPSWIARFGLPSLLSIAVTYAVLRLLFRRDLAEPIGDPTERPRLSGPGRLAAGGVVLVSAVLLASSAAGIALGGPTLIAASLVCAANAVFKREAPWPVLGGVSWSIVPLVAGLFVIVASLRQTDLLQALAQVVAEGTTALPTGFALAAAAGVALACNLVNNLPAGLLAGHLLDRTMADPFLHSAVAIGIDLGPNLSVTGSLATILWLAALRRQGEHVSAWAFLKIGAVAMPAALAAALAGLWLQHAR